MIGNCAKNIKEILRQTDGVFQVEKDAVTAATEATEWFLRDLLKKCLKKATELNKSRLDAEIILQVVETEGQYDFLRNVTPHDEHTRRSKPKRKRKRKIAQVKETNEKPGGGMINGIINTESAIDSVSNSKYELVGGLKTRKTMTSSDGERESDDVDFDSS